MSHEVSEVKNELAPTLNEKELRGNLAVAMRLQDDFCEKIRTWARDVIKTIREEMKTRGLE